MRIEEVLGPELYAQVVDALKGKGEKGKDLELGVINDGTYVPVDKYNAQLEKTTAAEALAAETNRTLDDLSKAGDPAALQEALQQAQNDAAALKEQHTQDLAARDVKYAASLQLQDAHDIDLVYGLIDAAKCEVEDGKVKGLDKQIATLRESRPFLFRSAPESDAAQSKQPHSDPIPRFRGSVPTDGSGATADAFTQAFMKG